MFNYYLALALRSLKRNVVLTILMIAAIGVGIGLKCLNGQLVDKRYTNAFAPGRELDDHAM